MKIQIDMLKGALFASKGIKAYYHKPTGQVLYIHTGTIFDVNKTLRPEDVEEIPVPHFSGACLRQRYFHAAFPDPVQRERLCRKYGIDDSPLAFIQDDARRESEYVERMHDLFEDHRIEYNDYHEYNDCVETACAILWCVQHGYDYAEGDAS